MSPHTDDPAGDSRPAETLTRSRHGDGKGADGVREADYLCVRVGERFFAVRVVHVSEVVSPSTITPVPHTPSYVPGVLNRHGRPTAVLDLGAFIGDKTEHAPQRIVVLQSRDLEAGIPTSEVVGIQSFSDDEIHPALPGMQQMKAFVTGHVAWQEHVFAVVDPSRLLESARQKPKGESPTESG